MNSTAEETWTQQDIKPRVFCDGIIIMNEWRGELHQHAYHDSTAVKYQVCYADGKTFDFDEADQEVRDRIRIACKVTRNPWPGCHWRDDYLGGEGEFIFKQINWPIGD